MSIPDSFCAISTKSSSKELIGLILSLSLHHNGANLICMVDSYTKDFITKEIPNIELNIEWIVTLDKYTDMNRSIMERNKIFSTFLMNKAEVIKIALKKYNDTLLLDCDLFILGKINNIDKTKDLGVSPHYMDLKKCNKYGFYNAGLLWCNNNKIPDMWNEYTKKSRFYEQASIEDLVRNFSYFEFGKNYNFGQWRFLKDKNNINIKDNKLMFDNDELKIIHIHFNRYVSFKTLILNKLYLLNRTKEIEYINKIIY